MEADATPGEGRPRQLVRSRACCRNHRRARKEASQRVHEQSRPTRESFSLGIGRSQGVRQQALHRSVRRRQGYVFESQCINLTIFLHDLTNNACIFADFAKGIPRIRLRSLWYACEGVNPVYCATLTDEIFRLYIKYIRQ